MDSSVSLFNSELRAFGIGLGVNIVENIKDGSFAFAFTPSFLVTSDFTLSLSPEQLIDDLNPFDAFVGGMSAPRVTISTGAGIGILGFGLGVEAGVEFAGDDTVERTTSFSLDIFNLGFDISSTQTPADTLYSGVGFGSVKERDLLRG